MAERNQLRIAAYGERTTGESHRRPFWIIISLLMLLATGATALAPAASAAPAYSPPSGAWARFVSDLNSAEGLSTGSGVTIALLSTGVDTTVNGLSGKVTNGPDYIFKPQASQTQMLGTLLAGFFVGEPGMVAGVTTGARILSLRTEPDSTEPGAQSFFRSSGPDLQQIEAKAIRYAAGHGAQVILTDLLSADAPSSELLSAVSYAVSKNVVIVSPAFPESGNDSEYLYPEGLPGVIGVVPVMLPGGTAPQQALTGQRNNSVLISGPADDVPVSSDFDLNNFGTAMGYVAATAAMIKQRYPGLSPALVARALAMSARYRPSGGYSRSYGFGVLDPYDAIVDAGQLAKLTAAAPAGATGVVAASGHFGAAQGVTSALPPIGKVAYLYWAGIAVGGVLLLTVVVLVVRRRRRRPRARKSGSPQPAAPQFAPQFAPQPAAQQYAGQHAPWQQYAPRHPGPAQPPPAYPTRPNRSPWAPAPPPLPQWPQTQAPPPPQPPPQPPQPQQGKAKKSRGWFDPP